MSGLSKGEARSLLRGVLDPYLRKLQCSVDEIADGIISTVEVQPLCDITTGDIVGYNVLVYNPDAGTTTSNFFDDSWVAIPSAPANSQQCSGSDGTDIPIHSRLMFDDNLGSYTPYIQFYFIDPQSGNFIEITTKTLDVSADYTVTGTATHYTEKYFYDSLTGSTSYTAPVTAKHIRIDVILVNDTASPPTLNTGSGAKNLYQGFNGEWYADQLLGGTFTLTIPANDIVAIEGVIYG